MGIGSAAEDALRAGKFAGKSADEVLSLAKSLAKSSDELELILKDSRQLTKIDPSVIASAKNSFKLDVKGLEKLGITGLDDAAVASKGLKTDTKAAGDLASDAKNLKAGEQSAVEAKNVQTAVKDTDGFLAQAKKACTSDKKICAAAVLGSAAAIYAADKYLKVKAFTGQITKIENDMDGGILGYGGTPVAKVTYSKPIDILTTDTIDFSGTDCDPSLDGTKTPYKIAGPTEVWIKLDAALTAPGSKGSFKVTTGVLSRLGQSVGEGAGAAGAAAGQAAGAAAGGLSGGLAGGLGGLLKGFTSGAGLWLAIACAVLIFGFIFFKFIM
jgi:hypothetical protein